MAKERFLIGVIGTEMQSMEQQRILNGITEQAQQETADIAVLSNVFNLQEPDSAEICENEIYDLMCSPDPDAWIVLSESFVTEPLRGIVRERLRQCGNLPVLLVGSGLPGFDYPCIRTSDANDLADITRHLIEAHGFRDIALLTGPLSLEVSRLRADGYRIGLEQHGIPLDEEKIYEGNFWFNSGEALAEAFLSGEKPVPEALICANDYMAFGVLDAFAQAGVSIPERMSVIGYEYIPERNLHTPLLTTYARNRTALGREAVQILLRQLRGEPSEPFTPPQGSLICGMTCPCSASRIRQYEELRTARTVRQYADWNLKSDMERRLTECRELDAFAKVMGDFMFMLRGVSDVLLCLREDWHRQAPASEILLCRSVSPWADHTVFRLKQGDLSGVTQREHQPGVFYWLPVCFRDRMFGYCVLRGDRQGCFDDVCRSWLKSVENGLEFLRLKADVRYLLQCRVLSGSYDSMTGMYSRDGLKQAYHLMQGSDGAAGVTALYLRCFADRDALCRADGAEAAVRQLLAAAQVILRFQGGISGRISEYEFLLLLPAGAAEPQQILCMVTAALLREMPVDSFFCTAERFLRDVQPEDFIRSLTDAAGNQAAKYAENRLRPHDAALAELRTEVYQNPLAPYSLGDCAASLGIHPDYFNRRYKECFGQSFHQDCIRARILYAAHLLMHTPMKNAEIAEYCGYTESKYFIRQFSAVTGTSPKAFRIAAEMLSTAQISEKEDSV